MLFAQEVIRPANQIIPLLSGYALLQTPLLRLNLSLISPNGLELLIHLFLACFAEKRLGTGAFACNGAVRVPK